MSAAATTELTADPRSPSLPTFFDNLDSFAEAPEGVAKLRELILDLAVRGKLVEQDENDKAASELLETIQAHKQAFIEANDLKRVRKLTEVEEAEQPFPAPTNWMWCRLGDVARPQPGFAFKSSRFHKGKEGVPLIRIRDILNDQTQVRYWGDFRDEFLVETGDYLIGMDGNFNVAKWQGPQALLNQRVTRLQWYSAQVEQRFVTIALQHRLFELQGKKAYTTVDHLSGEQIEDSPIPLPPLPEQRRIVSKVDGLMSLCDELESRSQQRVRLRELASRSCLDSLVSSRSRRDLASAWQRLADHFEVLYDTPETLAQLRQSILQLAVQGQLVPQDPNDEPADGLLDRIATEKSRLLNAKAIRKTKTPSPIDESDVGFDLPSGWTWTRFGNVILELRYGTSKRCAYDIHGVPVLRIPNVVKGQIDIDDLKFTTMTDREFDDLKLSTGDVLMIRSNGSKSLVGRTAVVNGKADGFAFAGYLVRLRTLSNATFPGYLHLALNCVEVRDQIEGPIRTTSGVKNINSTEIGNLLIPLPPLAEQERIVAKVDQLLSQCDELSARLRERQSATHGLLTATIHQLLNDTQSRNP